jgi:predicted nucleotidyltransferase
MSNVYKIDLIKIKQDNLQEIFIFLEEQLSQLDIDFYLIGAIAKDMWLSGVHEVSLGRITTDLDIAVLIDSEEKFSLLKNTLVDTGRFTLLKSSPYTLLFDARIQLDVLPFGKVNLEDINFSKTLALTAATNGFAEVYKNALAQFEIQGGQFAVSTLPGIVLLKLIAYDDRPEHRLKDLQDIGNIIRIYHRIADDLLFEEEHIDLLELSPIISSAQLLGRQLAPIIKSSNLLTDRVLGLLAKHHFIIEEELSSGSYVAIDIIKELEKGLIHSL